MTHQNGHEPINPEQDMDKVLIAGLRRRLEEEVGTIEGLKAEIGTRVERMKAYTKALQALTGEEKERKPGRPPGPKTQPQQRKYPRLLGDERKAALKAMILDLAQDQEEFRQVDIRTRATDPSLTKSSNLATGFAELREDGFIRFSRQEGNNKYFRLTRAAVNAEAGNAASV